MATAPSGPRRIRTNPFSSSSSSFCSKAKSRASASFCCCCGGELAWLLDSLSRSWADTHSTAGISVIPPPPPPAEGTDLLCQPERSGEGGGIIHELRATTFLGAPPPFPAGLTRSDSTSRRVWFSCFSSSAILAIDSFSASWSFSVSCERSHTSHWPKTGTAGTKATSPPVPELGGARGMEEQPWNPSPLSGHRDTLSIWQCFPAHMQISSCRLP
uniref:Uncharacterized protein n=1 Tax=Gopherus evgoodei TaxID=1825980 RepID=A0A8C5F259_9SAUR